MAYKVESADLMQYLNSSYHDPFIHARIIFDDPIDTTRMQKSILSLSEFFPLLRCHYDREENEFAEGCRGDLITLASEEDEEILSTECLDSDDRLFHVTIADNKLFITISHMLVDGRGLKELLYALACFYDGRGPDEALLERRMSYLLRDVNASKKEMSSMILNMLSSYRNESLFSTEESRGRNSIIQETIDEPEMKKIHSYARSHQVTLNDIFPFAYVRTLNSLFGRRKINIPFTSDLRKYVGNEGTLSNLSGSFSLNIKMKKEESDEQLIRRIHDEVRKLMRNSEDLCGTLSLVDYYEGNSLSTFLKRYGNLKTGNHVDFTNLGIIDVEKLSFEGNDIVDCIVYSAVQRGGCFQIAASTYKGKTTFSSLCNCTEKGEKTAKDILNVFKEHILNLVQNTTTC